MLNAQSLNRFHYILSPVVNPVDFLHSHHIGLIMKDYDKCDNIMEINADITDEDCS